MPMRPGSMKLRVWEEEGKEEEENDEQTEKKKKCNAE